MKIVVDYDRISSALKRFREEVRLTKERERAFLAQAEKQEDAWQDIWRILNFEAEEEGRTVAAPQDTDGGAA